MNKKKDSAKNEITQFEAWYKAQFKPKKHRNMESIKMDLAAAFKRLAEVEAEYRKANEEMERRKIATYVKEAAKNGYKF